MDRTTDCGAEPWREPIPLHGLRAPELDDLPFEIHPLELMTRAARAPYPHRHDFYQILYLTGGAGAHVVDFVQLPVRPPCLYFVSPRQVHFWELEEAPVGKVILFSQDFLLFGASGERLLHELSFFHALEGPPVLDLDENAAETFAVLIEHLEDEQQHLRFGRPSVLRAYLHILLIHAQRRYQSAHSPSSQGGAHQVVRRFKKMVSERCPGERGVTRYAEALGITAGHLNETVKAVTGRTAGQLIREEVMLEAKRLLAHGHLTTAEIAYHLKFADPSYFGRFFRRETGQSPGAFRTEFRKKYRLDGPAAG
jgi:AraC-like DNA-binding protein